MLHTDNVYNDLKPYTTKELSSIYCVCDRTFNKWIKPFEKEIGQRHGRYYNINQVKVIFKKLGYPSKFFDDQE